MTHPGEGRIQAYLDDQLEARERASVAEHLVACPRCRTTHDELREAKGLLTTALAILETEAPRALPATATRSPRRVRIAMPLARAAVLVLLLAAAAAAAAVPGSPVREWIVQATQQTTPPEPLDPPVVEIPVPATRTAPPTVEELAVEPLPPPAMDPLSDFQPFHVAYTLPALLNGDELSAAISRRYPPDLARRGVGGETVLLLWLDEEGRVARSVVSASSGQARLDELALDVAADMRFRPARNRDEAVRVIVQIPVVFNPEDAARAADR
jgi:TonB family protein